MSAPDPAVAIRDDTAIAGAATPDPRGFALYVHWPFCLSKCPYCDFNSHVRERVDHGAWRAALVAELAHYGVRTPGRTLTSVFLGGGTPSLMEPATVAAVLDEAGRHWAFDPDVEITMEANPTSVEAGRLAAFAAAGVNRVSLGVQALDDRDLAALGRQHGAAEALAAVRLAAGLFPRYSFDLIYARPGQTAAAWREELARALDEAGDHLSVYQLTIEPGTRFQQDFLAGRLRVPGERRAAGLYEATQEILERAGMPAYEISNHARPGGACRHNLTYWRYGDYVGIGPGAHGRLTLDGVRLATRQHRAPEAWLTRVEADGHATRTHDPLDRAARRDEMTMMGLRLAGGLSRGDVAAEFGCAPEALFREDALAPLLDGGFLELDGTGLRATPAGRQRLDAVLAALLA